MRKENVIRPEREALLRYINDGYAICNACGAVMDLENEVYVCPACGSTEDYMDYEYKGYTEEERTPEKSGTRGTLDIPRGCSACGGPYPKCRISCKLFDD